MQQEAASQPANKGPAPETPRKRHGRRAVVYHKESSAESIPLYPKSRSGTDSVEGYKKSLSDEYKRRAYEEAERNREKLYELGAGGYSIECYVASLAFTAAIIALLIVYIATISQTSLKETVSRLSVAPDRTNSFVVMTENLDCSLLAKRTFLKRRVRDYAGDAIMCLTATVPYCAAAMYSTSSSIFYMRISTESMLKNWRDLMDPDEFNAVIFCNVVAGPLLLLYHSNFSKLLQSTETYLKLNKVRYTEKNRVKVRSSMFLFAEDTNKFVKSMDDRRSPQIVFTGTKAACEAAIKDVTDDGELPESFFLSGDSGTPIEAADPQPREDREAGIGQALALKEIITQMREMRKDVLAALREQRVALDTRLVRMEGRLSRLEDLVAEKSKTPSGDINFKYVTREKVESLLALKAGKLGKFALALEKEVYSDLTSELALSVEERTNSGDRINFIREVIFKYFNVSPSSEQSVWQTAKNALNAKARALRRQMPATVEETVALTPPRSDERPISSSADPYDFFDDDF